MPYGDTTVGLAVLDNRGLFREDWWRWVGIAALLGFAILFNILVLVAQTYLGREPLPALPCFYVLGATCLTDCMVDGRCGIHVHLVSAMARPLGV